MNSNITKKPRLTAKAIKESLELNKIICMAMMEGAAAKTHFCSQRPHWCSTALGHLGWMVWRNMQHYVWCYKEQSRWLPNRWSRTMTVNIKVNLLQNDFKLTKTWILKISPSCWKNLWKSTLNIVQVWAAGTGRARLRLWLPREVWPVIKPLLFLSALWILMGLFNKDVNYDYCLYDISFGTLRLCVIVT